MMRVMLAVSKFNLWGVPTLWLERKLSTKALGSDIEYPLRSNALSAKSVLGGRVALTHSSRTNSPVERDRPQPEA